MKKRELLLSGAFEVQTDSARDGRGSFTRVFCENEFKKLELLGRVAQSSVSQNIKRHTLRGLHFQSPPHAEAKLIACVNGRVFDAIVDLRSGSPTFGKWDAVELSSQKMNLIYIPEGFAHGFLSLEENSVLQYFMSTPYAPDSAAGLAWNDPILAIAWPEASKKIISEKDQAQPQFDAAKAYF